MLAQTAVLCHPILDAQPNDALKLPSMMRDDSRALGQCVAGDPEIVGTDGGTGSL